MMSPRTLKKLTKKAEPLIIALGLTRNKTRVIVENYDEPLDSSFVMCCKNQLKGTVGYGSVEGYYEQEWSDNDCYSMLYSFVLDHYFDWGKCDGGKYPECDWPKNIDRSPTIIFQVARWLIGWYEKNPKKSINLDCIPRGTHQ